MTKDKTIKSYKGFDKNFKCREYQFELGKSYEHAGEVEPCNSGFHACEYPLDVFSYYYPATSIFAEVEQSGTVKKHTDDSKIASSKITVKAKISFGELIQAAVDFTWAGIKKEKENKKQENVVSNSGTRGAASNSGDYGAASNSGDYGAASNSGYQGAAWTEGKETIAAALAPQGRAKASKGSWIVVAYRDEDWNIKHIKTAQAGVTKGIKSDTFYIVNAQGKFIEWKE